MKYVRLSIEVRRVVILEPYSKTQADRRTDRQTREWCTLLPDLVNRQTDRVCPVGTVNYVVQ